MWYRTAIFRAQFWAALVLPAWLLVSRGIFGADTGWDFVAYLFIAPILAIALAAVAGLTRARRSARDARAVSTLDAAIVSLWWALIVAHSLAGDPQVSATLALVGIVVGIVAFWNAIYQLIAETRNRMSVVLASFEQTVPVASDPRAGAGYDPRLGDGPVIRIDPPHGS
ncbi:MFS transporter [Salinibacterium sp. ZJ450]|uniref:MFS transporter n=1 Tax=Salinibacterium sp. ZJ450 TaxID=2708338 RepID=UPI00141FC662|nr:MFS transporter [Salinibacterium sp. ZJ450]